MLYASGHPDLVTYRREGHGNLGLLLSRAGGRTWESVALKGQTDFHALTYSPDGGGELSGWSVAGQTGLHRISTKTLAAARLLGGHPRSGGSPRRRWRVATAALNGPLG